MSSAPPPSLAGGDPEAKTRRRFERLLARRPALRLGWWGLQIIAFVTVAVLVVAVSSVREITTVSRLAVQGAQLETELVAEGVRRQLALELARQPQISISELAQSPQVAAAILSAQSTAPSVLHVIFIAPDSTVLAHTLPSEIGERADSMPGLPSPTSTFGSLAEAWRMNRSPTNYAAEWPLIAADDRQLGTIRVVVGGTFLAHTVQETMRRGMFSAGIIVVLAAVAGAVWSRLSTRRLRHLVEQLAALREGHYEDDLPDPGWDEFSRLAHEVNLLGQRYQSEANPSVSGAQALARLGDMAAGVAHELRGPLQGLQFDLDTLESRLDEPDAARRVIEELNQRIQRLQWVLSGFLKVARIRPLQRQDLDTEELIESTVDSLEAEAMMAGVQLRIETPPEPGTNSIFADREVLMSAIENVLSNAIEAQPTPSSEVTIGVRRDGQNVEIRVRDHGPGIDPEVIDKIFDLYFTTKAHGSGVGLALVRQIVELHEGSIDVNSNEGEGTEVVLRLPVSS